jgi:hypothetical protein
MTTSKKNGTATITKTPRPRPPKATTFLLFGADAYAKPRAGRLITSDAALLERTAAEYCLRLVVAEGAVLEDLARRVPAGSLDANKIAQPPSVRETLYQELVEATAGEMKPITADESTYPASIDALEAGDIVVAHESQNCGWWEAVVIDRSDAIVNFGIVTFQRCRPS